MMGIIVKHAESERGQPVPNSITEDQALELFTLAQPHIPIAPSTNQKRKRRSTQLKMVTTLRLIREVEQKENPQRRTLPFKSRKRSKRTPTPTPS